jgi:hypothetical protein
MILMQNNKTEVYNRNNEINKNVHFRIKFKTGCAKVMDMLWHSGEKLLDHHIPLPWGIWTRCIRKKLDKHI